MSRSDRISRPAAWATRVWGDDAAAILELEADDERWQERVEELEGEVEMELVEVAGGRVVGGGRQGAQDGDQGEGGGGDEGGETTHGGAPGGRRS